MDRSKTEKIFKKLRLYILFCRSFKRDPIFRSVIELMEQCKEDIDPMSDLEALEYAVDQQSALILETAREHKKEQQNVGSGLFWSSPRHPFIFKAAKAAAAHGEGLHLRPYRKGLNEEENEENAEDIWDMIADNWKPNEQYDPYAYVKYFVRLQDMIEHDTIFQKVLDKVKTYMHTFRLPF